MVGVRVSAVAGAAALFFIPVAQAADLPLPPPMPMQEFSGWYLRGDIGFSNQQVKSLSSPGYSGFASVTNVFMDFDAAPIFGVGVGYQWNNWLRFDTTGEYRGSANFKGLDIAQQFDGSFLADDYFASKSEWLFLANAYVDLGTWWCLTPFVGAGIGTARVTIHHFKDDGVGPGIASVGFSDATSKWNLAWALHSGVAYKVTPALSVELAYRYVNLGSTQTKDMVGYDGSNSQYNPMQFNDITSHDLKIGVRWMLDVPEPAYAPPLIRKG